MEYKIYYYENKNEIIISESETKPDYDSLGKDQLKVNLDSKEVSQIYNYFKKITIDAILNDVIELKLNCEEIIEYDFFKEESFIKLVSLFTDTFDTINDTLTIIKETNTLIN